MSTIDTEYSPGRRRNEVMDPDTPPRRAPKGSRTHRSVGGGGGENTAATSATSGGKQPQEPHSRQAKSTVPSSPKAGGVTPAATAAATATANTTPAPPTSRPGIIPINTHINPALGINHLFTHSTQPTFPRPPPVLYPGVGPIASTPYLNLTTRAVMGDYQNAVPINMGLNFQPQVPDTTYGPYLHTYIPRNDCPGGVFFGQPGLPPAQGFPINAAPIAPVTAPVYPVIAQQPAPLGQPVMMAGQPMPMPVAMGPGGPIHMMGAVGGGGGGFPFPQVAPGNYGQIHPDPATGIGRTPGELALEQVQFAHAHNLYEPQDFKPADDDPSRHYFVRELDGNWTQRSRYSIDHMGNCRWYITDNGVFYAVRLVD